MAEYPHLILSINSQTNETEDKRRQKLKTSTRKRAAEESEHSESKISKEAAKIIQLKVSQEAVNVQLRDDIKTLECKTENQDNALINASNEIEHLKTEYHKEIRQREDTANKVITSRKICNVLEEHFGRVATTLTRCQNESKFLSDYFHRALEEIQFKEEKYKENEASYLTQNEVLRQNLTESNDIKRQLSESWSDNKKTLEVLIEELRFKSASKDEELAKLKHALENLYSEHKALTVEAASFKSENNQSSGTIQILQSKLEDAKRHHAEEINKAEQCLLKYKAEISKLAEEVKRTKEAVCLQEDFITNLSRENLELTDKLAQVEELNKDGRAKLAQTGHSKEKLEVEFQILLTAFNNMKQRNKELKTSNEERKQVICNLEAGKIRIRDEFIKEMDQFDTKQKNWSLSRAEMDSKMKILLEQNEELSKSAKEHLKSIEIGKQQNIDLQNEMKKMKNDIEAQINETVKDKVVDLVSEMKTLADIRHKLERNVDVLKRDLESSKQKEKNITERHEMAVITVDGLEQSFRDQTQRETVFSTEKVLLARENKKLKDTIDCINADVKAALEKQEEDKKQISLLNEELKKTMKMSASSLTFDEPISLKSPINTNINSTKRVPSPPLTALYQNDEYTHSSQTYQPTISSQNIKNHSREPRTITIPKYMDDCGLFSDSSLDGCRSYIPRVTNSDFDSLLQGAVPVVSDEPSIKVESKKPKVKNTKKADEVAEKSNHAVSNPKLLRRKCQTRDE